jgi:hypothetical protein
MARSNWNLPTHNAMAGSPHFRKTGHSRRRGSVEHAVNRCKTLSEWRKLRVGCVVNMGCLAGLAAL